jgi:hypothetical protein
MNDEKTSIIAPIEAIIKHLNLELRKCNYEEILSITFTDKNGARYSYQCPDDFIRKTLYY